MPPDADGRYFQATVDGGRVAAVGSAHGRPAPRPGCTYIAVDSADDAVERVRATGGDRPHRALRRLRPPAGWRSSPTPRARCSASGRPVTHTALQVVNAPGSWNFSDLNTARPWRRAQRFYGAVFGWEFDPVDFGGGPDRRWCACPATATTSSRSTPACASATPTAGRLPASPTRSGGSIRCSDDGAGALGRDVRRRRRRRRAPPASRNSVARSCPSRMDVPWSARRRESATRRARRSRSASSYRRSSRARLTTKPPWQAV